MSDFNSAAEAHMERERQFIDDCRGLVGGEFLLNNPKDKFLQSLAKHLRRYGVLTERQQIALERCVEDRSRERGRIVKAMTSGFVLRSGKCEVKGRVISAGMKEGFGGFLVPRFLVEMETGHRVWGQVPSGLECDLKGLVGKRVQFEADLDVKDEAFAIFQRPSSGRVCDDYEG